MPRTYSYLDLVQLPKLDGMSAQTLGTQVIAAAKSKKLPEAVEDALSDVESTHKLLKEASANRLPTTVAADPARAKAADVALDACWSGLFDILSGWSKIPDSSLAQTAQDLSSQIYPEGLKFLLLSYKLEWAESNTRLAIVKDRKLDKPLEKLGAGPVLQSLRNAHKEYGEALGVTLAAQAPAAVASLREALDEFSGALRRYVVCISASVRKKDAKSAQLAEALLQPIQEWQGVEAQGKTAPEPPPIPAPPVLEPPA